MLTLFFPLQNFEKTIQNKLKFFNVRSSLLSHSQTTESNMSKLLFMLLTIFC
jgi:hypothetical protein